MHVVYDVCCGEQETNKSRFYIGQPCFACVYVCCVRDMCQSGCVVGATSKAQLGR